MRGGTEPLGCHLPLQELPLVCPGPSSRSSARPYGKASSGPWDNSSLAVVMATLRRDGPSHRCFLHALESHREFFLSPNPLEQIPSRSQRRLRSQVGFSRFWLIFDARAVPAGGAGMAPSSRFPSGCAGKPLEFHPKSGAGHVPCHDWHRSGQSLWLICVLLPCFC